MLLGIPGDNTYSNYREANRALWRQTMLPLAGRTAEALGAWLAPAFGGGLRPWYDADKNEALSAEREALWSRIGSATFLTVNEKRSAVGYGELANDELPGPSSRKYNFDPNQPRVPAGSGRESGRWTLAGRSPSKEKCIEQCYELLERLEPKGTSLVNHWDFHRCVNKCLGRKAAEGNTVWTSTLRVES
jgi:hypothetical protein